MVDGTKTKGFLCIILLEGNLTWACIYIIRTCTWHCVYVTSSAMHVVRMIPMQAYMVIPVVILQRVTCLLTFSWIKKASACNRSDLSVIPHGATLPCTRFSIRHYTRAWMSVQFPQYRVYLLLPNLCELSLFCLLREICYLQSLLSFSDCPISVDSSISEENRKTIAHARPCTSIHTHNIYTQTYKHTHTYTHTRTYAATGGWHIVLG